MPTIILLDVSLSMTRPVVVPDCTEEYQRRHLAIHGINALLDYCAAHTKLEFMSLVVFSSLWELLAPFSRDYDTIKSALNKVVDYDKTCIETALSGIISLVMDEWGTTAQTQVVLITDGSTGVGHGSLKQSLENVENHEDSKFPLPFPFNSKLHIVCISPRDDPALAASLPMYETLIAMNNQSGEVFLPDGPLSLKSVKAMFLKLAEKHFSPYRGLLQCGHLQCPILVFPSPAPYKRDHDFEHIHKEVSKEMEIFGFLDIGDVASPPCISRHLVLPNGGPEKLPKETEAGGENGEGGEDHDEGRAAAFTVLLHGSLKVEGMVALIQLAADWFGIMYSWADSKKKSNLMLSIFTPGTDVVPWLGNIKNLAPVGDFADPPYGVDDNKTPFPVRPMDRRSYAQNCVVWIKASGLQADIQKILRHARKLPEKQQHFYKELNRLRKAALSFGFLEVLEKVSELLERECTLLPGNAHPGAALQLGHAVSTLRSETSRDININIMPLRTNFSAD